MRDERIKLKQLMASLPRSDLEVLCLMYPGLLRFAKRLEVRGATGEPN